MGKVGGKEKQEEDIYSRDNDKCILKKEKHEGLVIKKKCLGSILQA